MGRRLGQAGRGWDDGWDEEWQERVLARQLEEAGQVPGVYEQLSPAALRAYPVIAITDLAEAADATIGERSEGAASGACGDGDDPVALSLQDAGERVLARVEALEADRSRLDGRIVDAYAALHVVLGEQLALSRRRGYRRGRRGRDQRARAGAGRGDHRDRGPARRGRPPAAARHRERLRRAPVPARGRDGVAAARHPDRRGVRRAGRRRGHWPPTCRPR